MIKPPPTPPPSSSSKPTRKKAPPSTPKTPIRTIQDHGTVGAVANTGSDLSYDLSSVSSALEFNANKKNDKGNSGAAGAGSAGNGDGDNFKIPPPPNEVIINGNGDDVSLDDDKLMIRKGHVGEDSDKQMDSDQLLGLSGHNDDGEILDIGDAVIIQDLHQLKIDRSASSDHGGADDTDDGDADSSEEEEDDENDDRMLTSLGTGKELDLEHIAECITSGKCSKIIVLCGAGVSCSAGIPDFRTPGSGL